jgi:signal peptidase I
MAAIAVVDKGVSARPLEVSRILRWADRASSVVCGLALVLLAVLLLSTAAGYRLLIDHSGSMRPAIGAGDLLVTHAVPALSIRVGQVVSFVDPALHGRLVTHRVVAIHRLPTRILFVTRGDANPASESWSVARGASVGTLDFRVAGVGRAIAWMAEPWARTTIFALLAFVLSTALLGRIWRRR